MVKNLVLIAFMLLVTIRPLGACSFETKFQWVKTTFEQNDASFQVILDRKGRVAYDLHNQMIEQRIKSAQDLNECVNILKDWLKFFNNNHTGIRAVALKDCAFCDHDHSAETTKAVEPEYWSGDIAQFQEYLTNKTEVDYEGFWTIDSNYKIGIIKEGNTYIGFIIESKFKEWQPNMVKLKIENNGVEIKSTYFMLDFSPKISGEAKLYGNYVLRLGTTYLKRVFPEIQSESEIDKYLKLLTTTVPYIEELDGNTLYIRLPSFDIKHVSIIDKLVKENFTKITETENLIIDLRDNPGGMPNAFFPFIPFFYTNQLSMTEGTKLRVTPMTLQYYKSFGIMPKAVVFMYKIKNLFRGSQTRRQIKEHGEFIDFDYKLKEPDEILENPKNIGIIINNGTGSAAEVFALYSKQSKKVKVFGVPSHGCLDYGVPIPVNSPCGQIKLIYTALISPYAIEYPLDNIGVQPDFPIDSSIPDYKWVDHVNDIMQNWVIPHN